MLHREDLAVFDKETVDLAKRGVSDWSDFAEVMVAGDDLAPAAPSSVTATQVAEGIKLEWTNPTTNADGTTCNDLRWVKIYYKSTTGVSKTSNDGSYVLTGHVGDDQSFTDRIAAKTTRYYVLTALDKSGNESVESSEVHATSGNIYATPDIPDDATGYVFDDSQGTGGVILGDGIIGIVFQTPTWKSFDHYRLWYQYTDDGGTTWKDKNGTAGAWTEIKPVPRFGHVHKGLNTTYGYRYKATVVATDGTESTTPDTAGGASTIPNASDNSDIVGTLILAENIVATNEVRAAHIKAGTITADRLAFTAYDIDSNTLDDVTDGTNYAKVLKTDVSAGHILLSETVGDLDDIADGPTYGKVASTDISAGHITAVAQDASININDSTFGNQGIQLQYNSGTPRAYIGNGSDKYFKFDGTNVELSGSITIKGGSGIANLTDAGALATKDTADYSADVSGTKPPTNADNTKTVIDGGLITTGYINLSTNGNIRSGQTSFDNGTGFWLGNDSGIPKFSIGNSSGDKLIWDGSSLSMIAAGENAISVEHGSDILLKHGGDLKFVSVTAPGACTATLVESSGNVDAGDHTYKVTFVNEAGETELGAASNTVAADSSHQQVKLTNIPTSTSSSVTARKIYRTKAGGTSYFLLATLRDNIATGYTDNTADSDLGTDIADDRQNNTFGKIFLDDVITASLANYNTVLGYLAGANITVGSYNLFIGGRAGENNTDGWYNTFAGQNAGGLNTSGSYNTFIGSLSGSQNTTGGSNAFLGAQSGEENTEGRDNTYIGVYAGGNNTTGSQNVFVGTAAAREAQMVDKSVIIGADATVNASDDVNEIVIGYGQTGLGSNTVLIGNNDTTITALKGDVGIGTTGPSEKLEVAGGIKLSNTSNTNAGTIRWTGTDFQGYDGSSWVGFKSLWSALSTRIYPNNYIKFTITNSGYVGIGRTDPDMALDIEGLSNETALRLTRHSDDDYSANCYMDKSRGNETSSTIIQNGDILGNVIFDGYDGSWYQEAASVRAEVDGTPGANDMPGSLIFSTTPDGDYIRQDRMIIKNNGNVGIGTTSPGGGTTAGEHVLSIADGTAPVGGVSGQVSLYSSSGELYAFDSSGNATLLSPHAQEFPEALAVSDKYPAVYYDKNDFAGIERWIAKGRAFELLEELARKEGLLSQNEYIIVYRDLPEKLDWDGNEEQQQLRREKEIKHWKQAKASYEKALAEWEKSPKKEKARKPKPGFLRSQPKPYKKRSVPEWIARQIKELAKKDGG